MKNLTLPELKAAFEKQQKKQNDLSESAEALAEAGFTKLLDHYRVTPVERACVYTPQRTSDFQGRRHYVMLYVRASTESIGKLASDLIGARGDFSVVPGLPGAVNSSLHLYLSGENKLEAWVKTAQNLDAFLKQAGRVRVPKGP